jgi:hypothetical protein
MSGNVEGTSGSNLSEEDTGDHMPEEQGSVLNQLGVPPDGFHNAGDEGGRKEGKRRTGVSWFLSHDYDIRLPNLDSGPINIHSSIIFWSRYPT